MKRMAWRQINKVRELFWRLLLSNQENFFISLLCWHIPLVSSILFQGKIMAEKRGIIFPGGGLPNTRRPQPPRSLKSIRFSPKSNDQISHLCFYLALDDETRINSFQYSQLTSNMLRKKEIRSTAYSITFDPFKKIRRGIIINSVWIICHPISSSNPQTNKTDSSIEILQIRSTYLQWYCRFRCL